MCGDWNRTTTALRSKYMETAKVRNSNMEKKLQMQISNLQHKRDTCENKLAWEKSRMRRILGEYRLSVKFLNPEYRMPSSLSMDQKEKMLDMRAKLSPSMDMDTFEEKLGEVKRMRRKERDYLCQHTDPITGLPMIFETNSNRSCHVNLRKLPELQERMIAQRPPKTAGALARRAKTFYMSLPPPNNHPPTVMPMIRSKTTVS